MVFRTCFMLEVACQQATQALLDSPSPPSGELHRLLQTEAPSE
jgi:hypothetical protein